MQENDKSEFIETLQQLCEYYGRGLNQLAIRAWWKQLNRLSIAEFRIAAEKVIAECKFLPTPREVLEIAGIGGKIEEEKQWQLALEAANNLIRVAGGWHRKLESFNLSPAAIAAISTIGGIGLIKMAESRELATLERKFKDVYRQHLVNLLSPIEEPDNEFVKWYEQEIKKGKVEDIPIEDLAIVTGNPRVTVINPEGNYQEDWRRVRNGWVPLSPEEAKPKFEQINRQLESIFGNRMQEHDMIKKMGEKDNER